jgi:ZIP family zinc transporter
VPAFLFVQAFSTVLPVALGFAAGAMLAIAARDVLPEALDHSRRRAVFATAAAAFGVTLAFQLALLP